MTTTEQSELIAAIEWTGDLFDQGLTLGQILSTDPIPHSEEEMVECLDFYVGNQWPKYILDRRNEKLRPSLVINQLPQMVKHAQSLSRESGEDFTDDDTRRLIVILVRRNRDAQRLYNYIFSTVAESFIVRKPVMTRQNHPNILVRFMDWLTRKIDPKA